MKTDAARAPPDARHRRRLLGLASLGVFAVAATIAASGCAALDEDEDDGAGESVDNSADAGEGGGEQGFASDGEGGGAELEECDVDAPTTCPDPMPHYAEVEPIFAARCQLCHSTGGGQWPLDTYSHVADWAPDIHDLVLNCSMPPPEAHVPITNEERAAILEWLVCGHPQ